MTAFHDPIDFASLIINVTEALGEDTPPASSTPTAGFSLHRATMGQHAVLVKVFSGLPQGCLSPSENKTISKAFLRELGFWTHRFHSDHFVKIIGKSEYVDCVLPSPIYAQTTLAKEYLKENKNVDFLAFIQHITKGVEFLHRYNVVHGDIRADNVLIGTDGRPRIADYGLTQIVVLLDRHGLRGKTDVTPAMRWMPPELHSDDDILFKPSSQGDVWSLGMTIYELWSGNMPYLGTPVDKVPGKIRRGHLPDLPTELMPRLEALREPVKYLCKVCWQRNPSKRKTSAQLVHILQELYEGKSVSSISKEFESRENRRTPPIKETNARVVPPTGSIASSDTTESGSFQIGSVTGPSETSDSGYETVTSNHRGQTRKTEEVDTASSWSHTQRPQNNNVNGNGAFTTTGSAQTNTKPIYEQGQTPSTPLPPFNAFPPPPMLGSPLGSVTSWMTALLNYKAKHKMNGLKIERKSKGESHLPSFTTICTINDRIYAHETDHRKKGADEKAARETLIRLCSENPSLAVESFPSYLSSFKDYLARNELTDRVEWKYENNEDNQIPTWTCILLRDGEEFARETSTRKQDAADKVTKTAAADWMVPSR